MARIKFFIQSKISPAGIYLRLREGVSIDAKAKTKFVINISDWSDAKGQPKNLKDEKFKKLNKDLVKLGDDLLGHFNNSVGKKPINSEWLKEFINPPPPLTEIPNKLVAYFEYYAEHQKESITPSSYQKIYVNKHLLERFQKESKKEYLIAEVDANFKLRFESYCLGDKYAPGTIARAMKFIKMVCYHARINGIETNPNLDVIKVGKIARNPKIFLTPKEITLVEKKSCSSEHLDNARDWLVISCDTAQRVSDFMRFDEKMIRVEKKVPLIEFTQVKTKKIMTIPLSKRVMKILRKRKGQFPRAISEQNYNEYIKIVCKQAGIDQKVKGSRKNGKTQRLEFGTFEKWELVSSHIGRRSFANNKYGIIPTALLIGMTGHATEKQFLEYIGKSESDKAMQLAKYF